MSITGVKPQQYLTKVMINTTTAIGLLKGHVKSPNVKTTNADCLKILETIKRQDDFVNSDKKISSEGYKYCADTLKKMKDNESLTIIKNGIEKLKNSSIYNLAKELGFKNIFEDWWENILVKKIGGEKVLIKLQDPQDYRQRSAELQNLLNDSIQRIKDETGVWFKK